MGGKQKKLISINDNLKHPIQERGEIRSYECSLVYESKVERRTDSKLTGHSMKLLKINRLEEINTRFSTSSLEKTAFFQSVEKMKMTRSFQEEKFSESGPGTEDKKVIQEKSHFSETETKEKKPPDSTDGDIQQSQSCSQEEEVDKLNKENAKRESSVLPEVDPPKFHTETSEEKEGSLSLESHYEYRRNSFQESLTPEKKQEEDAVDDACQKLTVQETESESPADEEKKKEHQMPEGALEEQQKEKEKEGEENADKSVKAAVEPPAPSQKEDKAEQSHDEEVSEGRCKSCEKDDTPTPPAPFDHRIVSAKRVGISNYYNVNEDEILGGGRFGQVHKCEEKATGLKLAAKIIKAQGPKQKDEVKNEINVMNQLNHVNLIQLYDAFESKNDIVLVMEYVEGGELFDRIIDENYNLTEMDTISFIKQICKGIQYMHQMYILHLDLKPENILCVNREANQIKIIDFGLARRYKPREKLRVNFGTPEFLAPEVVNYEFVSFPTDMWSLGVIAYMLLTGLSPFLGDDDNETLNNILACNWDFEDEEFRDVSDEAKDFISKLLIKEKCWRLSATAALKHPWLTDHKLHFRLQKKAKGVCVSQAPQAQ
ncbi:myosin light chain kinase family member 4 [Catharus ustulatus]|uniref:myosin light chain kinase family member 4 n=1 Tax=Catharus ustulatus TaxID=91951 RepID=UPI001407BF3C|nr:myosin light chain kinase family member 4 [Catharus ustulatus]